METLGTAATAEWAIMPISGGTPTATATATIGSPTSTPTNTSIPTNTPTNTNTATATPSATRTPVLLRNKGNGQYLVYDTSTNTAAFASSVDLSSPLAKWNLVDFNGKLHICSVTSTEPYGPGQDSACWSEQAWPSNLPPQPTPPAAPTPGPDGHIPYVRVGSTFDSWGSNQFSLLAQPDGAYQIKVTGWYNDLVALGAYPYAAVTYSPSPAANAEWQVLPATLPSTPVVLQNKGSGQYLVYDTSTNTASFTSTID